MKKITFLLPLILLIFISFFVSFVSSEPKIPENETIKPPPPFLLDQKKDCLFDNCNLALYSKAKFVREDGIVKKLEDARSLNKLWFEITYLEEDPNFKVHIIDFNYNSITIDLVVGPAVLASGSIPVSIWEFDNTKIEIEQRTRELREIKPQDYKTVTTKIEEEILNFDIIRTQRITLPFGLNKILEFGEHSTTITLTTGLMAYWTFDDADTSGTTVEDVHSSYDGTMYDDVTSGVTGIINEAYDFPGTADYIDFGEGIGNNLSSTNNFTIQFWFNLDTLADDGGFFDMSEFNTAAPNGPFFVRYDATPDAIHTRWNQTNSLQIPFTDTAGWHHYIFTYNGTNVTIYLNGTQQNSTGFTGNVDFRGNLTHAGCYYYYFYCMDGQLDEVAVWNRSLNSSEVSDLYNDGQGLPYSFDLTVPSWSGNTTNDTDIKYNDIVEFNVTWSDDIALSNWIFNSNITGTEVNGTDNTTWGPNDESTYYIVVNVSKNQDFWYRFYANDTANNWDETDMFNFTVNNSNPTTPTIIGPTNNSYWNYTPVNLTYSSSDADLGDTITYYVYINNTLNGTSTGNWTFNATDSFYNWTVMAGDGTFNTSNSSTWNFTLDTIAPSLTVASPENGSTHYSKTITLNFTTSDTNLDYCMFNVTLTGSGDLEGSANRSLTCNTQTSFTVDFYAGYTVHVYSYDLAANSNSSDIQFSAVEGTAPFPGGGGGAGRDRVTTIIPMFINITPYCGDGICQYDPLGYNEKNFWGDDFCRADCIVEIMGGEEGMRVAKFTGIAIFTGVLILIAIKQTKSKKLKKKREVRIRY